MTVRAVLVDLDNTLTDRTRSLSVFARQFAHDFAARLAASQLIDALEQVMQQGDGGGYIPKEQMFAQIQARLSWQNEPPSLDDIRDYWYAKSASSMQLRPGALETVQQLRDDGYRTGIITNGRTDVQNATIDAIGIRPHLDVVIVSEAVGVRKPEPGIFRLALEMLQLEAGECWFVGDHPSADIQGAQRAGLTPVWLEGCHPAPDIPDFAPLRIREIPEILILLALYGG